MAGQAGDAPQGRLVISLTLMPVESPGAVMMAVGGVVSMPSVVVAKVSDEMQSHKTATANAVKAFAVVVLFEGLCIAFQVIGF
jgi:hypothetical protein